MKLPRQNYNLSKVGHDLQLNRYSVDRARIGLQIASIKFVGTHHLIVGKSE